IAGADRHCLGVSLHLGRVTLRAVPQPRRVRACRHRPERRGSGDRARVRRWLDGDDHRHDAAHKPAVDHDVWAIGWAALGPYVAPGALDRWLSRDLYA